MSLIDQAERLKRIWTNQYVQVKEGIPTLTRFRGLTGCVKTVNMNCRLLVEFQNTVDISWYDIDPAYVIRVETPKSSEPAAAAQPVSQAVLKPPATPASPAEIETQKKLSPIEMIRAQQAKAADQGATSGEVSTPRPIEPSSPPPSSAQAPAKPLSPIEMIRAQQAKARSSSELTPQISATPETAISTEKPNESAVVPETPKKLSPIEMIRAQQAARAKVESTEAPSTLNQVIETSSTQSQDEKITEKQTTGETLPKAASKSPIELIREQQRQKRTEAQKSETSSNSTENTPPQGTAKPLSPIEMIRQQQAAKRAQASPQEPPKD